MVTGVFPRSGPALGETPVTVGTGAYAYCAGVLVPPTVVTVIGTVPPAIGRNIDRDLGRADHCEARGTLGTRWSRVCRRRLLGVVVNAEPDLKPAPLIVTVVPPATGPASGLMLLMVGTGAYVYDTPPLVPPCVVTVTLTVPGDPAGTWTFTCVEFTTAKHGAPGHVLVTACRRHSPASP